MLASIILLISVAFCAQLHSCASEEFKKLKEGSFYVVRANQQNGTVCTELRVIIWSNNELTAELNFKRKTADGQFVQAEPIEMGWIFNDTTGFYDTEEGNPVVKVVDIKKVDGVTQVFMETKDVTLPSLVCLSTYYKSENQEDLINEKCPLGSDGKPFFPVPQDDKTCESDDDDDRKK